MWIEIYTSTSVSCLPAAFTMLVVKACDPSSRSYTRIAILAGRRPLSCIVFSNLVMTVCAGTRSFSCHLHDGWTLYHSIMHSSCTARFGSSTSLRPSSQGIVFENLGPRHNLVGAGFSLPLFNFSRKNPPQLRALISGITRKGNTTRILLCMQKKLKRFHTKRRWAVSACKKLDRLHTALSLPSSMVFLSLYLIPEKLLLSHIK